MITDALLNLALTVVQAFWALIPNWTITLPTGIKQFVSDLTLWDSILPVTELLAIGGLLTTCLAAFVGFKAIKQLIDWIIGVIP